MSTAHVSWEYNGVNLSRHAYDIRALGDPEVIPGKRGENVVIPHRTGRTHVDKFHDERVLTLTMLVKGTPVGSDTGLTGENLYNHLETLKTLFAQTGRHTLKVTYPDYSVRQAEVEVVKSVVFEPQGPYHYGFAVDFVFPDVWWEAATATTVGPTTISATSQAITVNNTGTYQVERAMITITGGVVNPKLWVTWHGVAVWVCYAATLSVGYTLTIDCDKYEALLYDTSVYPLVGVDVTDKIVHYNSIFWLPIPVGSQTVTFTCDVLGATLPTVKIVFTPVYV